MKTLLTFLAGVVVGLYLLKVLIGLFYEPEPEPYDAIVGYPN